MKKIFKTAFFCIVVFIVTACIEYKQNKGLVTPESSESSIDFITSKGLVIIPVNIDGQVRNFILDSGDDQTTVNRKELKGRVTKKGTATGEKVKVGSETIKSLKIGNMEFQDIKATNLDLSDIEQNVPNFGGLLGQAILSKANWLIDYANLKLTVSTSDIKTSGFKSISVKNIRDPFINVEFEGVSYKAFVDLGSSSALSVVESSNLGQILSKKFAFIEESKTTTTASGTATSKIKRGEVSGVKVSGVEINALNTVMGKSSSQEIRIGMPFFKDKILYLDYSNKEFRIK